MINGIKYTNIAKMMTHKTKYAYSNLLTDFNMKIRKQA